MLRSLSDFEGRNVPFICHLRVAEEELMKCFNSEMASLGPTVPSPADGLNGKSRSWLDGCSTILVSVVLMAIKWGKFIDLSLILFKFIHL